MTTAKKPIPAESSYIIPEKFEDLDREIRKLLDLRFCLVQSAQFTNLVKLEAKEFDEFIDLCKRSRHEDWSRLREYRRMFLNDNVSLSYEDAKSTTRLEPIDKELFLQIYKAHEDFPIESKEIREEVFTAYTEQHIALATKQPGAVSFDYASAERLKELEPLTKTDRAQQTREDNTAYREYQKMYRLPPVNLSRLIWMSSFDQESIEICKEKQSEILAEIFKTIDISKLLSVQQRDYDEELGLSAVFYALRSSVERIAFHNDGDVLKFLQHQLKAHITEAVSDERHSQNFAKATSLAPVYLNHDNPEGNRQVSERVGSTDSQEEALEHAESAQILSRLVLEALCKVAARKQKQTFAINKAQVESVTKKKPELRTELDILKLTGLDILKEKSLLAYDNQSPIIINDEAVLSTVEGMSDEITKSFEERDYSGAMMRFNDLTSLTTMLLVTMTPGDQAKVRTALKSNVNKDSMSMN